MKRVGLLIVGSGYYDGSSPWDVAFILRTIEKKGAFPYPFAPNINLGTIVNHRKNKKVKDRRNALDEAARLVRGEIYDMDKVTPQDVDALIIPGGYGNVLTLTRYNRTNNEYELDETLKRLIRGIYVRGKPIGALGYGTFLLGLALGKIASPILTPGEETEYIEQLKKNGVMFTKVPPDEVVFDDFNNLFSASGINPEVSILKGAKGIENLVDNLIEAKKVRRSSDERNRIR